MYGAAQRARQCISSRWRLRLRGAEAKELEIAVQSNNRGTVKL